MPSLWNWRREKIQVARTGFENLLKEPDQDRRKWVSYVEDMSLNQGHNSLAGW